eukprot:scaffold7203_cov416-Prasinococcus_capsulatus_cf.AAC.17
MNAKCHARRSACERSRKWEDVCYLGMTSPPFAPRINTEDLSHFIHQVSDPMSTLTHKRTLLALGVDEMLGWDDSMAMYMWVGVLAQFVSQSAAGELGTDKRAMDRGGGHRRIRSSANRNTSLRDLAVHAAAHPTEGTGPYRLLYICE